MNERPLLSVSWPCAVAVGREHRGGLVLGDAVDHDLRGAELVSVRCAEGRHGLAPGDHRVDLLEAAVALPPLRPDDVGAQRALGEGAPVHGVDVLDAAEAAADERVLPTGDAEGEQFLLRAEQSGVGEVVGDLRTDVANRCSAPSWKVPAGKPSASRSMRPSAGSGVVASSPASRIAAVFAHALWWSRLMRSTGRSGTTASSSVRTGAPPGKWSIDQPPPTIHASSGFASA